MEVVLGLANDNCMSSVVATLSYRYEQCAEIFSDQGEPKEEKKKKTWFPQAPVADRSCSMTDPTHLATSADIGFLGQNVG